MHLYFTPMSCSLASRMALCQAGLDHETTFHQVILASKTLLDGSDYRTVSPKGQVPALLTREGHLLTENAAVLQYIADLAPDSGLAPAAGTFQRVKLQERLSYISSELHKAIFYTIFNPGSPEEARSYARETLAPPRLDWVNQQLAGRDFLLEDGGFSVADAYLVTVLNWLQPAGLKLSDWPHLHAYHKRLNKLAAVARAVQEDYKLWAA